MGMTPIQVDTCNARIIHLLEKPPQVRAPPMVNVSFFDEPGPEPLIDDTDTHINILAEPHSRKPTCTLKHPARIPHIEAAGMKLLHLLVTATDAPRSEKGGHGVVNCPLYGCKIRPSAIRPAECIGIVGRKFPLYRFDVAGRQYAIRIKENQVIAR